MKVKYYIFILALIFQSIAVYSQTNDLFSSLNQSQTNASITNPAFLLNINKNEFSIAPFTSFNLAVYLPITSNKLFSNKTSNGKYLVDLQDIYLSARRKNIFFLQSDLKLFSFSGANRKFNWNISVQERIEGGLAFNKEAINFINLGNKAYLNESIKMNFPIHFLHFRSFNFTLAKQFNSKLDVGLTMKMYLGRSLLNVNSTFDFFTEQNGEYVNIDIKGKGRVSSPISLNNLLNGNAFDLSLSNYLFCLRNPGLGLDFGLRYEINDDINFNASVQDLGFIYWNKNTTKFNTDGVYEWNGVDISGKLDFKKLSAIKENNTIETFRDSFLNGLIVPVDGNIFTFLPSQINIGINYYYSNQFNFAASVHTQLIQNFLRVNLAFSGSYLLNQNLTLLSGLSLSNLSYVNVPLGLAFKNKKFGASLSVGNVFSVLFPSRSHYFGGSFNLSYRLGKFVRVNNQHFKDFPFFQKRIIH